MIIIDEKEIILQNYDHTGYLGLSCNEYWTGLLQIYFDACRA